MSGGDRRISEPSTVVWGNFGLVALRIIGFFTQNYWPWSIDENMAA